MENKQKRLPLEFHRWQAQMLEVSRDLISDKLMQKLLFSHLMWRETIISFYHKYFPAVPKLSCDRVPHSLPVNISQLSFKQNEKLENRVYYTPCPEYMFSTGLLLQLERK